MNADSDGDDEDPLPRCTAKGKKKRVLESDEEEDDTVVRDDDEAPLQRSARKHSGKLSGAVILSSSDSEAEKENGVTESHIRPKSQRVRRKNDDDDDEFEDDEWKPDKTSVVERTPESTTRTRNVSTPSRKSTRLESREKVRNSKQTPERRAYLEAISPRLPKGEEPGSGIRKRLYANSLVLGRNSYNTERQHTLIQDSDSDDDFIVDDNVVEENNDDDDSDSDDDEDEDNGQSEVEVSNGSDEDAPKRKKRVIESSTEDDEEKIDTNETPRSSKYSNKSRRNKTREQKKKTLELLKNRRKGVKKKLESESEEEDEETGTFNNNIFNDSLQHESDDEFIDDAGVEEDIGLTQMECVDDALKNVKQLFQRENIEKTLKKVLEPVVYMKDEVEDSSSDDQEIEDSELTKEEESFLEIVYRQDMCAIEDILRNCPQFMSLKLHGKTILHIAASIGNCVMVELLLDLDAKPSLEDDHHYTALGYAARNKHAHCLKVILENENTDLSAFGRKLHKNFKGMNLIHFIISDIISKRMVMKELSYNEGWNSDNIEEYMLDCLQVVFDFNKKMFLSYLSQTDRNMNTPLLLAIVRHRPKVMEFLLSKMTDAMVNVQILQYATSENGNLLHFAVLHSAPQCLSVLIPRFTGRMNDSDDNGFTPLMYAVELSANSCVDVLLNFNASVHVKDHADVSPLHLAACKKNLHAIQLLINSGHKLDCVDTHGWPPLLYAIFHQANKECISVLMEKNPQQIFCLGRLIRDGKVNEEQRAKNIKIIKDTLVSISQIDRYYTIFNDFIARNISLLDDNNQGCFVNTWRMILSFSNKVAWMRMKSESCWNYSRLTVDRSCVLDSALRQLPGNFSLSSLRVSFKGEAGMCLGPKREFCSLLVDEFIKPENHLFANVDREKFFLSPNHFFLQHMKTTNEVNTSPANSSDHKNLRDDMMKQGVMDGISFENDFSDEMLATMQMETGDISDDLLASVELEPKPVEKKVSMREREKELDMLLLKIAFAGKFVAQVILDNEINVQMQLCKPLVKLILGLDMNHPSDLDEFDHLVYSNIRENEVDDLDMVFSVGVTNPWNGKLEEVMLGQHSEDEAVTEANKGEYLVELSQFKLEHSVSKELKQFCQGFYDVIRPEVISIFNADEFSLLLNGVTKIDVEDWKKNTRYVDWSYTSPVVVWFWEIVEALKEEEKSLLLKFSTGSPCVPAGGFAKLLGLGKGTMLFTISKKNGMDKIPEAATCFNSIRLYDYSSKAVLREKILIAIRHGCEGFAFA